MIEVTSRDFAELARRRGWSAAFLAEHFRGKIEEPREFFERAPRCKHKGEDRSDAVVPYASVPDFYRRELSPLMAEGSFRSCGCGCGKPVYGRKRLASSACRKRMERRRSQTLESGSEKCRKDGTFAVTFQGGAGLDPYVTVSEREEALRA
jgi:hypothetical protein